MLSTLVLNSWGLNILFSSVFIFFSLGFNCAFINGQDELDNRYLDDGNFLNLETPLLLVLPVTTFLYEYGLNKHGDVTSHLLSSGGAFNISYNGFLGLEFSGKYSLFNGREKIISMEENPYDFNNLRFGKTNFTYRYSIGLKLIEPDLHKKARFFINPRIGRIINSSKLEIFSHRQDDFDFEDAPKFLIREETKEVSKSFYYTFRLGLELKLSGFNKEESTIDRGFFFFLSTSYTKSFSDLGYLDFNSSQFIDEDDIDENYMALGINKLNFTKAVNVNYNPFESLGISFGLVLRF